ncbi:hypothetical protein Goshw_025530 [Gossypium schwendimanii]|uniref:DUF4283 domain-containing protein n=1 Tax=Gossypium schwendimanii TaxID=34291 RepID=A0A7J9NE94_GOSSC|nr:hypothetical protein [Gossypium schwendimanii]
MATTRFDIEKFNVFINFNLWQGELDEKAMSAIQSCLTNRVAGGFDGENLIRLVEKNVKVKINDENQAMLLLCSLPSSYKSFRETLIYGKNKISFEDVNGHLLSKDKLNNEFGLDSKADRQVSVLVASKNVVESNEKNVAGANLANESGDNFLLVSTSDSSKLTSDSVEGGVVCMENNSSSKVIDIDNVKIRMHDGRISVSWALILLKGKKTDSLYILEGSTVISETERPSSVIESKSTRLERRQLGHRRKKCMIVSLKRGSLLDAGFEKLGHCVRENQTRVCFDLAMHKLKARSRPAFKYKFDSWLLRLGMTESGGNDEFGGDGISLLAEELIQLSVKSLMVEPNDKPSLVCSVWTKKSYNQDSFKAQMKKEDLETVMEGQPWLFRKHLTIFDRLIKPMERDQIKLVSSPFWIKIGPCLQSLIKKDLLHAIGVTFGGVLRSKIIGVQEDSWLTTIGARIEIQKEEGINEEKTVNSKVDIHKSVRKASWKRIEPMGVMRHHETESKLQKKKLKEIIYDDYGTRETREDITKKMRYGGQDLINEAETNSLIENPN